MHPAAHSLVIRTLAPHEWPTWRDLRLRSLADSPDAFGSTYEAERVRPDEGWEARLAAAAGSGRDCPMVAELDGTPVGLTWARADAGEPCTVELFQVWVAPESRGCGVAASLIGRAIGWARAHNAVSVHLGVTLADSAAVRLYRRAGFRDCGAPEPLRPGSALLSQPMRLPIGPAAA